LEQLEYSNTKARAEYQKQLEQAAAVGQWEAEWKEQIKMTLHWAKTNSSIGYKSS
jgi:hypothetical protein